MTNRIRLDDLERAAFAIAMCATEAELANEHQRVVDHVLGCCRDGSGVSHMLFVQLRKQEGDDETHLIALCGHRNRDELRRMMFEAGAKTADTVPKAGPRIVSHTMEAWYREFPKDEQPDRLGDLSQDPAAKTAFTATTTALSLVDGRIQPRTLYTMFPMRQEGDRLVPDGSPQASDQCDPTLLRLFFAGFQEVVGNRIRARHAEQN